MTLDGFRQWVRVTARMHKSGGGVAVLDRAWAAQLRPFDPRLAELYLKLAEASEAIRVYIVARAEEGEPRLR